MPIWECGQCQERVIIGSVADLEKKTDSGSFYIMRHGEAESNVKKVYSSALGSAYKLTAKGKNDAKKTAQTLKDKGIDLIICSDLERTRETASIVADELGIQVIEDSRLREVDFGDLEGKPYSEEIIQDRNRGSDRAYPNGENWTDIRDRLAGFYRDLRISHNDKKVLIVSHGDPLTVLEAYLTDNDFFEAIKDLFISQHYINKAELRELPHRIKDIHSHFIDGITWPCPRCKGKMHRIKEVFDCWVESGSMSFAQHHYPFENKEKFESTFPAQYISEYISQTRAWFYVMHVMSTALFDSNSFENVATTGVILTEKGEKMSKSKKNFPDPSKVIDEFGADALRLYLMSSSIMHSENINFNELDLRDVFRKNVMLLWNVYKFYSMYASEKFEVRSKKLEIKSDNILDSWILARLDQLIMEVSENMDKYDLPRASRPLTDFINDLSTWYIRRSRDRFKSEDNKDKQAALATTGYVLMELSKLVAPFMPFITEQIWQKVSGYDFKDEKRSVHLEPWTTPETQDFAPLLDGQDYSKIIEKMEETRKIVELGLAARDEAGIRVRQPLQKLEISNMKYDLGKDYKKLIEDEVNVKEVKTSKGTGNLDVKLTTELTLELKQEGIKRELVRFINALRKDAGLTIKDKVEIFWTTDNSEIKAAILKHASDIAKDTLAGKMDEGGSDEADISKDIKINGAEAWIGIKKS